jgi:hypothetical protein
MIPSSVNRSRKTAIGDLLLLQVPEDLHTEIEHYPLTDVGHYINLKIAHDKSEEQDEEKDADDPDQSRIASAHFERGSRCEIPVDCDLGQVGRRKVKYRDQ